MTGAYLFAVRNGKRTPIEIEHLTDHEREERLKDDPERLMQFLHCVCNKLAEIEKEYFVKDEETK